LASRAEQQRLQLEHVLLGPAATSHALQKPTKHAVVDSQFVE
jgi:hypothetical protein